METGGIRLLVSLSSPLYVVSKITSAARRIVELDHLHYFLPEARLRTKGWITLERFLSATLRCALVRTDSELQD